MSDDYYNQHAKAFFDTTKDVEMTPLTSKFLSLVPAGGHILDAGCGSGRDSKFFKEMSFSVTAIDASEQLAAMAQEYIGQPVEVCRFMDFSSDVLFDGIWACASLLHVPASQLPQTFSHLASMLKSGAAFYCSFKYGTDDIERDGRAFTNCDELRLQSFINNAQLVLRETWITSDLRPGRENEKWLNAILFKE
ncbi:class I SAM-dependent methyltransferase [Shewanella sp. GXUN23E]|uniref:class I SAM-dependent methyltransferase n=1 Tax=Shewanella sp. GXUN23E TaxID=3422498 RepID=UPI003D7DB642